MTTTLGSRGGWSWTLQTENRMKDPQPQLSLSQSLRLGAYCAHRQLVDVGPDYRNFRRSTPVSPLPLELQQAEPRR